MRYLLLCLLVAAFSAHAQLQVEHAQLENRTANGTLTAELHTLEAFGTPLWVAYTVPTIAPFQSGWYHGAGGTSYLERDGDHGQSSRPVPTGHDRAVVLLRLANGNIGQLRAESPDHPLDAGGLRFVTLTGITPADSIATLREIASTPPQETMRDTAVFLIGQHDSPAATPALLALAAPSNPIGLRDKAAFWLANAREHTGFLALQTFARNDRDSSFREKLTFDLTLSPDHDALAELIRMAHDDPSPHVRRQAQFWMARQAAKGEEALIASSLRQSTASDPDPEVRKQAVFAISQLPGVAAVTELTRLAATSSDPEVRKQAVFWLGQSNDPRALAYLTGLLRTPSSH